MKILRTQPAWAPRKRVSSVFSPDKWLSLWRHDRMTSFSPPIRCFNPGGRSQRYYLEPPSFHAPLSFLLFTRLNLSLKCWWENFCTISYVKCCKNRTSNTSYTYLHIYYEPTYYFQASMQELQGFTRENNVIHLNN